MKRKDQFCLFYCYPLFIKYLFMKQNQHEAMPWNVISVVLTVLLFTHVKCALMLADNERAIFVSSFTGSCLQAVSYHPFLFLLLSCRGSIPCRSAWQAVTKQVMTFLTKYYISICSTILSRLLVWTGFKRRYSESKSYVTCLCDNSSTRRFHLKTEANIINYKITACSCKKEMWKFISQVWPKKSLLCFSIAQSHLRFTCQQKAWDFIALSKDKGCSYR